MSSTRAGGIKAAQTNKERYGNDFYRKVGKLGGTKSRGGGFASVDSNMARLCGQLGGLTACYKRNPASVDINKIIEIKKEIRRLKAK